MGPVVRMQESYQAKQPDKRWKEDLYRPDFRKPKKIKETRLKN